MKNTIKFLLLICIVIFSACDKSSSSSSDASAAANGSLTRFITAGNYLYIVDNSSLKTYSLLIPSAPVFKNSINVGFAIQTIFVYQDKLFIGSSNNMYIYGISNPEIPSLIAEVTYFVRGRDPIVANDSVAYSTVRNEGQGIGGVLNVFNLKNIKQPQNMQVIPMQNPYGLGIKDSALYVCESTAGLKVFNIKNAYSPLLRTTLNLNETFYDVIVQGNILVCYIKSGIAFIDISSVFNPIVIATIKN